MLLRRNTYRNKRVPVPRMLKARMLNTVPDEGIEPPTFGLQNRCMHSRMG